MDWGHLVAFNVALIAAMLSPGPALLLALRTAITSGRLAGIATGAGLGLMASLWTLAALVGLDIVFALFPWAYLALKTVGALYLIYLAWMTLRETGTAGATQTKPAERRLLPTVRTAFLINILNPKLSVFFLAFLPQFIDPAAGSAVPQLLVLGGVFMAMTFVVFAVYGSFAAMLGAKLINSEAFMRWMRRGVAAAFAGFGLRLALSDR